MGLTNLGLTAEATASEVRRRYKELAQRCHPDKGGTAEQFLQLQEDYQAAMLEASTPKYCDACHGSGRIFMGVGFNQLKLMCQECLGKGEIQK